ncbi:MAG TPA: glycosyltransferase [Candidatus Nanopelagicales bacterium]|nr:glycosyltransferase [Candidatus Nanopelagicales bacterium]
MARIVHLANFFGPRSGGLRTTMLRLAEGYRAAGHEVHLVVPSQPGGWRQPTNARVHTLSSVGIPRSGGYRLVLSPARIRQVLDSIRPDVIELSDRLTLMSAARWARRHHVPCTLFAHERVDGVFAEHAPHLPGESIADRMNTRIAQQVDRIVTTTRYAAEEFHRVGIGTHHVPLGVDSQRFRPAPSLPTPTGSRIDLVMCSRLSREKHPQQAIAVVAEAVRRGYPWHLTIVGDGPLMAELRYQAVGLPVTFTGFLPSPDAVATQLQKAHAVLAPGPIETFGLAALESLACGTPVVCNQKSALPEVVGDAGVAVGADPREWVEAVEIITGPRSPEIRRRARARALSMSWDRTITRMLSLHHLMASAEREGDYAVREREAA